MGGEAPTLGTGLGGEPGLSLRPKALPHGCAPAAGIAFLEVEGKQPRCSVSLNTKVVFTLRIIDGLKLSSGLGTLDFFSCTVPV